MKQLELSTRKQFALVFLAFVFLGICFKVMVLVEGLTEIRPVNAIPVVAGLLFGPVGAWACAWGNLAADCFGTLQLTSSLGFLGNFVGAYLPYRMWYLYRQEAPHVHTAYNLLIYIWITFVAALAASWLIAGGIWFLFGFYIENLALYIFLNDLVFPLIFGLPVFIVLTSDSIRIACAGEKKSIIPVSRQGKQRLCCIYALLLAGIFVLLLAGEPEYALPGQILSVPALLLTLIMLF